MTFWTPRVSISVSSMIFGLMVPDEDVAGISLSWSLGGSDTPLRVELKVDLVRLATMDLLEAFPVGFLDTLEPLVAMAMGAEGCDACGVG